ncbi:MAG: 1-deoxy-D-xylulose-5-phosphate synthase [Deltaproteobacteria bacterium]|nr:MAG: 1-deoxy-D-xylulose-5-phosphate synthase [Deltaproteobacteria bacterium]
MPGVSRLAQIQSPADLKKVPREKLPEVASELRETIVRCVARTGGHLASSLGVVELTVALHYVFHCPDDRIVWDVGHQAYAHKILTGRRESFSTLRTFGGISGFPRVSESPYDAFGTGHSGTSISAALGMAVARDLRKGKNRVVAVIGDGSLSSGLSLEGLNQAGHQKRDLVVVLNDNEWSISQNVGALSGYLNRIMTGKFYTSFRKRVETLLKSMPHGEFMARIAKKSEELTKGFIVPGLLFEELGFTYIGPIPGHDIETLLGTFQNLTNLEGPVLVHVVTSKGRGYAPAEANPESFHGVGAFDPETGKGAGAPSGPSYTDVFSDAIVAIGRENPKVVAITAAMCSGTGLKKFKETFPDRFFDVGIAESHAVTFAAGLAREGKIPVVAIYSTFLQRAFDQIIHDVCLQNLPVVFAVDRGGIAGADGATHQGLFDLSFLRQIPNLSLMAPRDEAELARMLRSAVAAGGPVAVRYPRGVGMGVSVPPDPGTVDWGKGELLAEGKDVLLLGIGSTVATCLQAAEALQTSGVSAAVVDARFVKPLDADLLLPLIRRIGKVITVEENVLAGGFGSAVMEMLEEHEEHPHQFRRIGIRDRFVEHGTQSELRAAYGLSAAHVTGEALRICASGKSFLPSILYGIRSRLEKIV